MKPIATLLLGLAPLWAEETPQVQGNPASLWNVELPPPIVQEAREPAPEPEPIDFHVLTSRTKEIYVRESPEMPELPPVEGPIKVTVQKVADPGLPDPPPPLPALPPDDPAVIAQLEELRETYRGTELAFVSASVVDGTRTLLTIYPNGQADNAVTAWSNVNFLHYCGQGGYRVTNDDGTTQDVSLLMGISPVNTATARRMAARAGQEYEAPEIPQLPDLATAGPAFVVVEGAEDSPAMDVLEQVHDLYAKSGKEIEAAYIAREQARQARKEYLLANPPTPKVLTIRVWRRTPAQGGQEGGAQ